MLAHIPSFGLNPRGSPDFLAYPVPKACMHVLGTGVLRRLGVAGSASSPKAAQALGCSLTPGLRISFGRVTCMARAASVPGLWTLGFLLLCGVCVWVRVVFGLEFRLRPATPGWGVGLCVCSFARSPCTPPLLAGPCGVGVCFGSGFGCAPPILAGMLGNVCVRVLAPLVPRHSWPGCAEWVGVLGLWFRLRPATAGWGVGVCVCPCARSACSTPLLAGLCGVCVCVWARVSAAPRNSWLGCWGVCVFLCPLCLYPATPGRGVRRGCVCFGLSFGCATPLLAGLLGCVCARVPARLVPRHSWLGCVVWVCVFGLRSRLRPATPGWGVGVCACARVPAPLVPRHSWLESVVWVCVFGLRFRLRPATPGWGVGVCVCVGVRAPLVPCHSWLGCAVWVCVWARVLVAPRHSCLGCCGVCVFVCLLHLYPGTPGWGVRRGCVCLGLGFGCALPLLAGVLGCVCVRVPAPLVPRHSWLGCVVYVCVFRLMFRLRPATPGLGVGVCVCSRARSACTPPLLARMCCVVVCAWAPVSAAPRHSWLGCWGVCVFVCPLCLYPATPGWGVRLGCVCLGSGLGCAPPLLAGVLGCVCVCLPAPLLPRHSWLGWAVWVCVLGLGFQLRPATPRWGVCVFVCPLP